jgi:hypothetical protein
MKYSTVKLFIIVLLISFSQIATNEFEPKIWEAPYLMDSAAAWSVERFPIPISFAPKIPYKGFEDIRFTPGWGNEESTDNWFMPFYGI